MTSLMVYVLNSLSTTERNRDLWREKSNWKSRLTTRMRTGTNENILKKESSNNCLYSTRMLRCAEKIRLAKRQLIVASEHGDASRHD